MKRYSLKLRGKRGTWIFPIVAKPEHVKDWRADGLEVDEVVNTIPDWVVGLGLTRVWVWMQDAGLMPL